MTVIRKRTGDKGGCCNPYSELQLEIERVDQTAIDAKTTANDTEAYLNTINGKVNEAIAVVPQVQTNTEAIAAHDVELIDHDARIHTNTIVNDQQNTDIAALKTKTNDNAAAIETLENEVGPETVAGTIKYRLKEIDTKLPTAIKEVEMIANASTVTHKATHISGTAESDALPVVSREQAGIMSASVYAAMEDVIANNTSRISVLEQSAPTYDISGLVGPNPTNAEISAAFQQKYPNVPIQSGLRAADYDNAHFWQYGKNTWIILTQIDVQIATNQSLGIVKGSSTDGKIFVETDGSMSLKGYDALVSKDATHDSKIGTLEAGLGNANARIDATNTNVANNAADIVTANGNISTNTNDINDLKGKMATAEGQIATHETKIDQHTQSINGLTTDVNGLKTDVNGLKTDVNGLKGRMTTAEGQIATHETEIDQHTQSINGLTTDVNGLETTKQDKLTAGTNITIENNVISAKGAQQWKVLQSATASSLRTIYEVSSTAITVKKTFRIKVCFGTVNYNGGVHATLGSIEKGVYSIDSSKSVCSVGAGASMVQEGDTNSTLFIGWWLSRNKDNNTGSALYLGVGYNIAATLIGRDYYIDTNTVRYDVNVDSISTFPSYGSYGFCIEYLDE